MKCPPLYLGQNSLKNKNIFKASVLRFLYILFVYVKKDPIG